jgi:hypothetical protein
MSITGIGASNFTAQAATKTQNRQNMPGSFADAMTQTDSLTSDSSSALDAITKKIKADTQEFLDYMKKTPAQRMQETWFKQHGITKEQFDAMSPADQQKVLAQMKQDIEEKIKERQEAENRKHGVTDILA